MTLKKILEHRSIFVPSILQKKKKSRHEILSNKSKNELLKKYYISYDFYYSCSTRFNLSNDVITIRILLLLLTFFFPFTSASITPVIRTVIGILILAVDHPCLCCISKQSRISRKSLPNRCHWLLITADKWFKYQLFISLEHKNIAIYVPCRRAQYIMFN